MAGMETIAVALALGFLLGVMVGLYIIPPVWDVLCAIRRDGGY